jgi:uncharacterized membrane protein YhaH (DUF805 family)
MINWFKKVVFENYANFNGRAGRPEYWYYVLATIIISILLGIVDSLFKLQFGGELKIGILGIIFSLAILIPGLAVAARRLHDIGKSGWYYLVILIPIAGVIWQIILLCTEGEPAENQYGESPKVLNPDSSSNL